MFHRNSSFYAIRHLPNSRPRGYLIDMTEHIICVTADSGLPLFTRTKRGVAPLQFPVMASLNGVHFFARNRDVNLVSTLTTDHKIVWKTYEDSIVLIAMIRNNGKKQDHGEGNCTDIVEATISDSHYLRILDNIFHSLVLLTGLDELCKHSNVERLKKDLRASYKIIDSYLDAGPELKATHHFGIFTDCIDMVLCDEAPLLQEHLDAFVKAASSTYGCLIAGGRVVCATERWWMLTGLELSLLGRLIGTLSPSATSCDIPVYLPHSSANVPHRLLVFSLITNSVHTSLSGGSVRACVLCGPDPSLMEVQSRFIERFWRSGVDTLQKCVLSCVTGFPPRLCNQLPSGLLAFLLVNRDSCQCVSSLSPIIKQDNNGTKKVTDQNSIPLEEKNVPRALHDFYTSVVGTVFPLPENIETDSEKFDLAKNIATNEIQCSAHYQCLDTHKAFALRRDPYQIFCLYHVENVPAFAMRDLTNKTLDAVTSGGLI